MVAKDGVEMGTTMVKKVRISPEPSILADSIRELGIDRKKFFIIITFIEEASITTISTQILFFSLSVWVMVM